MYNGSTLTPQRFNFIPPIIDDVLLDSVGRRVHNVIHPFGINLIVFNFRHTSMKPFHGSITGDLVLEQTTDLPSNVSFVFPLVYLGVGIVHLQTQPGTNRLKGGINLKILNV